MHNPFRCRILIHVTLTLEFILVCIVSCNRVEQNSEFRNFVFQFMTELEFISSQC